MVNLDEISKSVIKGDDNRAMELTREALAAGVPAQRILNEALIPGLKKVGDLFGEGKYFFPELIVAGIAVKKATEILRPILAKADIPPVGKYLIGTVKGDVHDIGKNVVIMMLEGNGWDVTDLGVDVSAEQFCEAVEKGDYQIMGMSSLLTTTLEAAAETIKALEATGLRDKIEVMFGGAPVTQAFADDIGADAYAPDAAAAVTVAARLVGK